MEPLTWDELVGGLASIASCLRDADIPRDDWADSIEHAAEVLKSLRQQLAEVTTERDRLRGEVAKLNDALRVCKMPVQVEQAYHAVLAAVAASKETDDGK